MCPSPRVNDKKNAFQGNKNMFLCFSCTCTHAHMFVYSYFEKSCRKNVHATIPNDQYTFPDSVAVESNLCCFPLAVAHIRPWPFVPILSYVFDEQ